MDEMLAPEPTTAAPRADRGRMLLLFVVAGLALVALARVLQFGSNFSRIASDQLAPDIFYLVGYLAISGGLAATAVWHRGFSWGARAAMLLGAAYFLFTGGSLFTVR